MRSVLARARRAAGAEGGFTLTELLVAMVLGLLVMGTGVMVFSASVHTQPELQERGGSIQQARTTMERLIREVRQGTEVQVAQSNQFSLLTYVDSSTCGGAAGTTAILCRVTYTCTGGSCVRVEALPNGSSPGPTETVVTDLLPMITFTYSPSSSDPAFVNVTFSFDAPAAGDDAITLQDGATLRNASS